MTANDILAEHIKRHPAHEWIFPRIGLYIPHGRNIPSATAHSLIDFCEIHRVPRYDIGRGCQLDMMRSRAAAEFLKSDLTYLLFLDDDHVHPYQILNKLAFSVARTVGTEGEIQVIGGMNYKRSYPHEPCVWVDRDESDPWDGSAPPDKAEDSKLGIPTSWDGTKLMRAAIVGTASLLVEPYRHGSLRQILEQPTLCRAIVGQGGSLLMPRKIFKQALLSTQGLPPLLPFVNSPG